MPRKNFTGIWFLISTTSTFSWSLIMFSFFIYFHITRLRAVARLEILTTDISDILKQKSWYGKSGLLSRIVFKLFSMSLQESHLPNLSRHTSPYSSAWCFYSTVGSSFEFTIEKVLYSRYSHIKISMSKCSQGISLSKSLSSVSKHSTYNLIWHAIVSHIILYDGVLLLIL